MLEHAAKGGVFHRAAGADRDAGQRVIGHRNRQAGRILEHNTPEEFFTNPQTARAQQFLEKFSFVSTLPKKIKELELI